MNAPHELRRPSRAAYLSLLRALLAADLPLTPEALHAAAQGEVWRTAYLERLGLLQRLANGTWTLAAGLGRTLNDRRAALQALLQEVAP